MDLFRNIQKFLILNTLKIFKYFDEKYHHKTMIMINLKIRRKKREKRGKD